MQHPQKTSAFTLIELLLVMSVITILSVMVIPSMSKFMHSTRVQQAAQAVFTALYRARAEAQRFRQPVAVFYGDDPSHHKGIWASPLKDVLPKPGTIEIWTVKGDTGSGSLNDDDGMTMIGGAMRPDMPYVANKTYRDWYPYHVRQRLLTPTPITFPDGVRIVTGFFNQYREWYNKDYRRTAVGEIKRHNTVFSRQGGTISPNSFGSQACAYNFVLIFDEVTGDHVIIQAGSWKSTTRPRLLPYNILNITYGKAVKDYRQLSMLIDTYPENWSIP
jgi:prepilin-type N-terminal cleavage/methylation domain-containing protein